ncbi:cytochrome b [Acetobacter sp.]|jgi:ubiquinol-cytochrome c reductase cytochrome b subunit|uniref:cytochrome b n=1 Tax=Acetobacter sp. TaxID=440 RepID=UPI0025C093B2|nr:cytochrome b N-terminal domain-containing protein [Acetobacter sp.]MCH4092612.1 cytochrome b N-terminal domain-containing protein [Acetobacter sp.]MCI1299746.1 cytochrome b N-terminal domain-containing protein [Acetobacter sp.]MCI1315374.1 cytochrome b N-terminal domain-containing protein [Acetobacter sp.]
MTGSSSKDRESDGSRQDWFDNRLPVRRFIAAQFRSFPMPRSANMLWTVGAMLSVVLVLMLLSGLVLAMNYTPTAAGAFASIEAIERRVPSGWLMRSMHMAGASLFLGALYLHLFRGLYYGSYKKPRELVWLLGLVLLVMTMITAFAGYVLPWGQMSYWGADIAGKALASIPGIGPFAERVFLDGNQPGDGTLHHLFVLHFTLAFAIVAVVGLHVASVHVAGSGNPSGVEPDQNGNLPFSPYFAIKDAFGVAVFAIVLAAVMFLFPDLVTEAANYRPANPLRTPTNIEPEWYFLPFYGMLQAIPFKFGGLLAAVGAVAVLFLVPWLDTSSVRSARQRPLIRLSMILLVASFMALGLAGKHHMEGHWLVIGRCATVFYFFHFLVVLPFVSRRENAASEDAA